jgi:excisionase family DNA binding protein
MEVCSREEIVEVASPSDDDGVPSLTVSDLATRWSTNRRLIWVLVERGEIPIVRIGPRLVRFRPSDVIAYEQAQSRPAIRGPLAGLEVPVS